MPSFEGWGRGDGEPKSRPSPKAIGQCVAAFRRRRGFEDNDGNFTIRPSLVAVVVGPLPCHDRPQLGLLIGRRRARASGHSVGLDLDLDIGVRLEVEVPRGVLWSPAVGRDDQVVIAVAAVDQRV
jgi:hypothetical protein